MKITFFKYQGAGNDFVIIDNRETNWQLTNAQIAHICDRRFGIGADGLMYLENQDGFDFKMVYFNADGKESTMCGNGGRCISLFAKDLGIIGQHAHFMAIDGSHTADVLANGEVALGMIDVSSISFGNTETILNTGSPHIVIPVDALAGVDVYQQGKATRNEARFGEKGINVNFVETVDNILHLRTYERGVEDETLACGTGVTAAAISAVGKSTGAFSIPVKAKGGDMNVRFFKATFDTACDIILTGPAQFVFKGEVKL